MEAPASITAAEFIDGLSRLWDADWAEVGDRAAGCGVGGWRWDQAWEAAAVAGGLDVGLTASRVARSAGAGARAGAAAAGAAAALAAGPGLSDDAFLTLYQPFSWLIPSGAGGAAAAGRGEAGNRRMTMARSA